MPLLSSPLCFCPHGATACVWLAVAACAFSTKTSYTASIAGGCWHDAVRLRRRREERRCARTQQRQCCAAAGAGSGASAEEPPRAQQHGSAGDSAWQRSQEWARLLLTLPLELSAIGAKTEAHWLRRRNRSSWWRSNARFPKARCLCLVQALGCPLPRVEPGAGTAGGHKPLLSLLQEACVRHCDSEVVGRHSASFSALSA